MKILAAISFGLTVAVSRLFLVLPMYSTSSSESPSTGQATLLEINGAGALFTLPIPALIALVPVLIPIWWVRIVAGLVLAAFVVVGSPSIGMFYFPSAVAMLLAGLLSAPERNR